jgi:hypothetical protein
MTSLDHILYERLLPEGPAVRIRRTSEPGACPVTAVLEVERRITSARASRGGTPPSLTVAEGASDDEVVARLEPLAREDAVVQRLMVERGLLAPQVAERAD